MSEDLKKELAAAGDEAWMKIIEQARADGKLASELPPADFMGRNFDRYEGKIMLLPDVDMGDFAVDRNGDRYFQSTRPSHKGFVCKFFPELLDKLRKFASILGPLGGGKVELLGKIKEVYGWWNNWIFIDTVAIRIPGVVVAVFHEGSAALVGEDKLEARLAELKTESNSDLPSGWTAIPSGTAPEMIAKLFYHFCVGEENRALWEKILSKESYHNGQALPRVDSWWSTMKKGNRSYYYVRTAEDEPERKKYFFQMQIDGADNGSPKPVSVVKEGGEWRIDSGSP